MIDFVGDALERRGFLCVGDVFACLTHSLWACMRNTHDEFAVCRFGNYQNDKVNGFGLLHLSFFPSKGQSTDYYSYSEQLSMYYRYHSIINCFAVTKTGRAAACSLPVGHQLLLSLFLFQVYIHSARRETAPHACLTKSKSSRLSVRFSISLTKVGGNVLKVPSSFF